MLQHEQTDPHTVSPTVPLPIPNAADARVTPDELNAALKALEDRQSSTVAIGSVVDELRLNATPEQIWDEVQQQRAQQAKAPQAEGQSAVTVRVAVNGKAALSPAAGRRRLRTWRDIKSWAWILFWCGGGMGLFSGLAHLGHHAAAPVAGIVISGDDVAGNYVVQGTGVQRDVSVGGDGDTITLRGDVRNLVVTGDKNTVTVFGSVEAVTVDSDHNTIHWTKELRGKSPQPVVNGDDNKVGLSGP